MTDAFPEEAQLCLANMCFQLGRPTLNKFKKSIALANDQQLGRPGRRDFRQPVGKANTNRAKRISDRLALIEVPA